MQIYDDQDYVADDGDDGLHLPTCLKPRAAGHPLQGAMASYDHDDNHKHVDQDFVDDDDDNDGLHLPLGVIFKVKQLNF